MERGPFKAYFNGENMQICPVLNVNEIQIPYDGHDHKVFFNTDKKSPKHTQFCQIWSNMKCQITLLKYEILIKQSLLSILIVYPFFPIAPLAKRVWK